MLIDYIRNPKFGYLFSFIVGVGIIVILGGGANNCSGDACTRFKAPPTKEIDGAVYRFEDKCYSFKTTTTDCGTGAGGSIVEAFTGLFSQRK